MPRWTRRAAGLLAPTSLAALLVLAGGAAAQAAPTSTLTVTLTGLTGTSQVPPEVMVFSPRGALVDEQVPTADETNRTFTYASAGLAAGTYKVGITFNLFHDAWTYVAYAPRNASFFYATKGGTTTWSKATTVTLGAGATVALSAKALSGAHLTGKMTGAWADGETIGILPVGAPTAAARIGLNNLQHYNYTTHAFTSAAVLPGKYRIATYTDFGTRYYTGNNKKWTTTLAKAKVVTVTSKTKPLSIGTFKAR